MKEEGNILIFDIGKTNKKVLIFDYDLNIKFKEESKFDEISDDDGFSCDDIKLIELWIDISLEKYLNDERFNIIGINFTTYGASFMHINKEGKLVTPLYNYLKTIPEEVSEHVYRLNEGKEEFCRKTASPALNMLNSGLQLLWLKMFKKDMFNEIVYSFHFPQYLSYRLTKHICSEHTSIGCHTALWDFDNMTYHNWMRKEGIDLPEPESINKLYPFEFQNKEYKVGIGIHDSSASLAPYLMSIKEKFILISTGTWCISMNPFNQEPLTQEQLQRDCLSYMSINENPVKSSRLFLGHIHDINLKRLTAYFEVNDDLYKNFEIDELFVSEMMIKNKETSVFFKNSVDETYVDNSVKLEQFTSFEEAYAQLMIDLTNLVVDSIELIIPEGFDEIKSLYVTGGFSKNEIFIRLLASIYKTKKVYTSIIDNATSLGAAMVIAEPLFGEKKEIDLGLNEIEPFNKKI